jgi:hypothetical protein
MLASASALGGYVAIMYGYSSCGDADLAELVGCSSPRPGLAAERWQTVEAGSVK